MQNTAFSVTDSNGSDNAYTTVERKISHTHTHTHIHTVERKCSNFESSSNELVRHKFQQPFKALNYLDLASKKLVAETAVF